MHVLYNSHLSLIMIAKTTPERLCSAFNKIILYYIDVLNYNNILFTESFITLQMFINGALLEEIPFARVREDPQMPADNKLYVGCRVHNLEEKDFTNAEMDELAFWNKYLPDEKLKWFTGAISEYY